MWRAEESVARRKDWGVRGLIRVGASVAELESLLAPSIVFVYGRYVIWLGPHFGESWTEWQQYSLVQRYGNLRHHLPRLRHRRLYQPIRTSRKQIRAIMAKC